jgi:transcriptional regulator with XRE-family HTH domain
VYIQGMKFPALAGLLKAARQARGIDQQVVARHLDLGQQAVSTWERGMSRPRASQLAPLAELLGIDVAALRVASEYDKPTAHAGQPRLRLLPFEQLSDEAFEGFVRDLLRELHPSWDVTRNGSTGYKQYGVDVFAISDDNRIGVQCKHEQSFGPSDVKAAVNAVLPEAGVSSGILALSRPTATPQARLEMANHQGWGLWDGEDLASRVRELPLDRQLRLIDAYFPRIREDFLGVRDRSPWYDVSEFDIALAGRLGYDKDFELTGRDEEFTRLSRLIDDHRPLIIVAGRGGIGKSRLLIELARTEAAREVRFAAKGTISTDAYDLLPEGAPVIVIDDALDADAHMGAVLAGVRGTRPDATVVLAVRPNALEDLGPALGLSEAEAASVTVDVGDLSLDASEKLAETALGDSAERLVVEALAAIGYDCPLLIVLGAHLVRAGNLSPHELTSNAELKSHILTHFAEVIVGGSSDASRSKVLTAIATTQPARLDEPEFLDALTGLSGLSAHEVMQTVNALEDLGVVLRRGHSVRVVPDVLGEALLERALVSRFGTDNLFAAHVALVVHGSALANAINNVSIVDFHRRLTSDSNLAEKLWDALIASVERLSNTERIALSHGVQAVAPVHPRFALLLAEEIIANPAPDELDPLSGIWGGERYKTARNTELELAQLIRNACYSQEHLPRGMRLLLDIGLNDARAENQNPSHAMRLLREMAEYAPGKPFGFNSQFIDVVEAWVGDDALAAFRAQIMRLLKPILAIEVTVTRSRRMTLELSRIEVKPEQTAAMREHAIAIAETHIKDPDPRVGLVAIEVLGDALNAQNRENPVNEEFDHVCRALHAAFSDANVSPSVRLSAFRALNWYASYGRGERRAFVREHRRDLAVDTDYLATRLIRGGGWGLDDDEDDDTIDESLESAAHGRYERSQELVETTIESVIAEWATGGEDSGLVEHLLDLLRGEEAATGKFESADRFLVRLFAARPTLSQVVLAAIHLGDHAENALRRVALATLIAQQDHAAIDIARAFIELGPDGAWIAASATLEINGSLGPVAREVVRGLAQLGDSNVSARLLTAARWWDPSERELVLEVITMAPAESDQHVAEDIAELLADGRVVSWSTLPPEVRQGLLDRFVATPELASYAFGQLLNAQIPLDAMSVLRFLQARIDRSEAQGREYEAIPFSWDAHLEFRQSPDFGTLLRELAVWLSSGDTWQREMHGTKLFKQIVGAFDQEVLALILSLLRTGTEPEIRLAASLLDHAEQSLVLEEPQFVEQAITIVQTLSSELGERVTHALHSAAAYGWGSRPVGEDNPREVALMEGARALAAGYPAGTLAHDFYTTVAEWSQSRMASERDRDAQLIERRRW